MLENKERAPPKLFVVREEQLLSRREPHYLVVSRFSVLRRVQETKRRMSSPQQRMSSHILYLIVANSEESSLQFHKKRRAAPIPLGSGRDPLAGPLPQQLKREAL